MGEQNGDNPRLKRIEEHIEVIFQIQRDMQQEHQLLLRAQVVQGEEWSEMKKRTDEKFQAMAEAGARMEDALTAMMGTLDGFGKRTDEILQQQAVRHEAMVGELAESHRQTDAAVKELTESTKQTAATVKELSESTKQTDATLRALLKSMGRESNPT